MVSKRVTSITSVSLVVILIIASSVDYIAVPSGLRYNVNKIFAALGVETPKVIMQKGTEGTSTLYTNATSAYVAVDTSVSQSSVGTSISSSATGYPFQRKTFYANGRYWVFYSDVTGIFFRSSTDGKVWSDPTSVRLGGEGEDFSLHFDTTNIHMVYAYAGSFTYQKGIPNSDGTISWGTEYTVKSTDVSENRYLTSQRATGNIYQLPLSNTNPSENGTTDILTGTTAINNYFIINPFTQTKTFVSSPPTAIQYKGWCSPDLITKTYPKGYWILYYELKNRAAYAHAGTIYVKYWKSSNIDMSGATPLTSWIPYVNVSFSATAGQIINGSSAVYVPNDISLNNEYLYIEFAWKITTKSTSSTAGFSFVVGEESEYVRTPTHQYYSAGIAVDSKGYPWISYCLRPSDTWNRYIRSVVKSTTEDGSNWGSPTEFDSPPTPAAHSSSIVALTDGKAYALYSCNSSTLKGFLFDGKSWGSEEKASDHNPQNSPYFSIVSQGDNVHVVYLRQATYQIRYKQRTYGSGWGTEEVIQESVTSSSAPLLTIDAGTNILNCFWAGYPKANYIYYKKFIGGKWDTNPTTWIEGQATQSLSSGNDTSVTFFGRNWYSQSFISIKDDKIWSVQILAKKVAMLSVAPVYVDIYYADEYGKPGGVSLGSVTILTILWSTSFDWRTCTFLTPISVSANQKYCLVVRTPLASIAQLGYNWAVDSTSPPYGEGNLASSTNGGSTWIVDTSKDALFKILFESTLTSNDRLTCFSATYQGRKSMAYLSRTQSPYDIKFSFIQEEFNNVLKVVNKAADNWKIRLRAYDQTDIGQLQNCTIYFVEGVSRQIYIQNGVLSQPPFGDWHTLDGLSTIHIVMTVSKTGTGKSRVYAYLEILVPNTSVYSLLTITFEIA